jgi:RNA polymerase sigma factor (sigma-70 family)
MSKPPVDHRALLVESLPQLRRMVQRSCAMRAMSRETDDVLSAVTLKLLENDGAAILQHDGRGSFAGYLARVVDRFVIDYQNHEWGKWRPSADAVRLGDTAVLLDQFITRDGIPVAEALASVAARRSVPFREVVALHERIVNAASRRYRRTPRALPACNQLRCPIERDEQHQSSTRLRNALAAALALLEVGDRQLLFLRFVHGMSVRQVASELGWVPKRLYRYYDRVLSRLRRHLRRAGFEAHHVESLLLEDDIVIEFQGSFAGRSRTRDMAAESMA